MTKSEMTSRQRMLAALNRQEVDHTPCSFMLYKGLLGTSRDYMDFIQRQIDLGLDVFMQLPPRPPHIKSDSYNLHGLPVSYDPIVTVKEWKGTIEGEKWPVLFKDYITPARTLQAEVYQDPEWPYGDHVPFLDDYIETRSRKFLINTIEDLPALSYLLILPTNVEKNAFKEQTRPVLEFAQQHQLLVAGGWGVGADLVGWVYGLSRMMFATYDHPDLLQEILHMIFIWNQARMRVVLEAGVDLYIKRAWYENCDFWSPRAWKKFVYPLLKTDVELAHSYGAKFGYLITANCLPLHDSILEAGVDVLIGVDPARWDLLQTKDLFGGKIALWGGVNGHLSVEKGSPGQVRSEVQTALSILVPQKGFILSPVDNVREDTPVSHENVLALIDEWQQQTGQR